MPNYGFNTHLQQVINYLQKNGLLKGGAEEEIIEAKIVDNPRSQRR